jgi:hypothetical protein
MAGRGREMVPTAGMLGSIEMTRMGISKMGGLDPVRGQKKNGISNRTFEAAFSFPLGDAICAAFPVWSRLWSVARPGRRREFGQ